MSWGKLPESATSPTFLSRMEASKVHNDVPKTIDSKAPQAGTGSSANSDDIPVKVNPVSIAQLYRYASRSDMTLMVIGIICAAVSGGAQPVTTVVFGSVSFVVHSTRL